MMLRILHSMNLVLGILLTVFGIVNFTLGNIGFGIADIIIAILNFYSFLTAVARWWYTADIVHDKFVFTCPKCGAKQIPSFWEWFFVPHIFSTRYLKCQNPECKKHSWMRRK